MSSNNCQIFEAPGAQYMALFRRVVHNRANVAQKILGLIRGKLVAVSFTMILEQNFWFVNRN
ncbi:hypothetical protein CWC18_12460 [Pseudoalteromonas aurantia]|uniref:Uncharacterized protein n=1 Tax=Pseudoalteromonas aurantia TaxID=43654 RepID=A0A5S3VC35_9GAMM|nr:hypothetical protein CWC18_12460 [Pseudoalteromonas aurantia]TMO69651.1 hypothetical protein CWC19_04155 [Pseudoalteromonas aurantia]TMO75760.1 hypothetical protein CWC20_07295 [Pseudoalteromonas aurantia]